MDNYIQHQYSIHISRLLCLIFSARCPSKFWWHNQHFISLQNILTQTVHNVMLFALHYKLLIQSSYACELKSLVIGYLVPLWILMKSNGYSNFPTLLIEKIARLIDARTWQFPSVVDVWSPLLDTNSSWLVRQESGVVPLPWCHEHLVFLENRHRR